MTRKNHRPGPGAGGTLSRRSALTRSAAVALAPVWGGWAGLMLGARGRTAKAETQAIFPGQAEPIVSASIIAAFNHALRREYAKAKEVCLALGRALPDHPAGPTGEMVLYQVMMLENEDYQLDREFRDAARRAVTAADQFARQSPRNDWYYTLLGATWGIQGIYFLRRDEFMTGLYYGAPGLNYMHVAEGMSETNWEAKLGVGLFLYYRSAYARFIPIDWLDQREKGIAMVKAAGQNRAYLNEVSRIALFYIYVNEKNYDQAFAYIDALIAQRPNFPIFHQFAGRALLEKGDYQPARDHYRRMSEIDPNLYYPYLKLAECSLKLGKKDDAKRWLDRFDATLGKRESVHRKPAEKLRKELTG